MIVERFETCYWGAFAVSRAKENLWCHQLIRHYLKMFPSVAAVNPFKCSTICRRSSHLKFIAVAFPNPESQSALLEVVDAGNPLRLALALCQRRQKQSSQNRQHGDDDKQSSQRERVAALEKRCGIHLRTMAVALWNSSQLSALPFCEKPFSGARVRDTQLRPTMKKLSLVTLPVIILIAAIISFNGCKQSPGGSTLSGKSAEKNSFNEVASQLDAGGNFYLYLSTEQWLDGVSGKVDGWRNLFSEMPGASSSDLKNINKAFNVVTRLIKDSGVEDVSGFGMSSLATEKGFYRTKAMLHHYKGKGDGFLWTMFGDKPHTLDGLDLLPASTAFATFSDLNIGELWTVIQKEVEQSDVPELQKGFRQLPKEFEKATGLNWEKVLGSFGGEVGVVLTLDESKMIPVPLPGGGNEPLEVPEPGLMIVAKVNDDTIFNRIDAELKKNKQIAQMVVSADKGKLKMRTVPVPLPLPIQLRPTIATSDGYLFIATTDALIQEALAVKGGKPGLKSSDEFKHLSKDVPSKGNHFSFISKNFGTTFVKIQQQAMGMKSGVSAAQKEWMQSFMSADKAMSAYTVGANTEEGWLTVGNGNQNPAAILAATTVVLPVAVLAGIAVPNFTRARGTAQKNACINNLRQIDGSKQQWALENKKKDDETPTEDEVKVYLKNEKFPVCPQGGHYTIGKVNEDPTCSVAGHQLMPP